MGWSEMKKKFCCKETGTGCEGGSFAPDGTYQYDSEQKAAIPDTPEMRRKLEDQVFGTCDRCCTRNHVISLPLFGFLLAPLICFKMCICMCFHTIMGHNKPHRHGHHPH